jgi:hypothetical protein
LLSRIQLVFFPVKHHPNGKTKSQKLFIKSQAIYRSGVPNLWYAYH